MQKGTLYLIPTTISAVNTENVLPEYTVKVIKGLKHLLVENAKTTRSHLKDIVEDIKVIDIKEINKHRKLNSHDISILLKPIQAGEDVGVMSESGCPGIADPGNPIVLFCHQSNIRVIPLIGPSSIFMTLMASGLNGQHFKFVGYLDKDIEKRKREIKNLEQESKKRNSSMMIMETPYRSEYVWKDLIMTCREDTYICVAVDVSGEDEFIQTAKASQWINMKWPEFNKKPAIFILQAS